MQDMSTQDAPRIGPQKALQSYLDDLLLEATPDRPDYAEAYSRPQPTPAAAEPELQRAPAARPMAREAQVIEPRPLVLPTIKMTDIRLVESPVDEAAAPIRTALAEPTPMPTPAPVVEIVNEPQPIAVSVAVSVSLASPTPDMAREAAAPVVERTPFPETVAEPEPLEPVVETPAPLVAPAPIIPALSEAVSLPAEPVLAAPMAAPAVPEGGVASAPPAAPELREAVAPVLMPAVLTTAAPVEAPPQIETALLATAPPIPPKVVSGRPQWGENRFECLLFDVAGLTLAVPLICLGTIHSLEGQTLTPLFGQPDWFLGMLNSHAGNLKVIDTARWVMPERYRDDFRDNLSFVITIQGFDWGLAVHKVDRSIHLHPDQIKWRSLRTQRPWLAGTVIEHMCALLDVAALAELIESGALKHAR